MQEFSSRPLQQAWGNRRGFHGSGTGGSVSVSELRQLQRASQPSGVLVVHAASVVKPAPGRRSGHRQHFVGDSVYRINPAGAGGDIEAAARHGKIGLVGVTVSAGPNRWHFSIYNVRPAWWSLQQPVWARPPAAPAEHRRALWPAAQPSLCPSAGGRIRNCRAGSAPANAASQPRPGPGSTTILHPVRYEPAAGRSVLHRVREGCLRRGQRWPGVNSRRPSAGSEGHDPASGHPVGLSQLCQL